MRHVETTAKVHQCILLPRTGVQIIRGFPLNPELRDQVEELWKLAAKAGAQSAPELVRLVREHIACNRELEASEWVQVDPSEFVFFRLTRAGEELLLDLVVDTMNGAGSQVRNKLPVQLDAGRLLIRRRHHLADLFVEEHVNARNEIGSLIMDFGNTGSAFVFARSGAGPLQTRVVQTANPFDPRYLERPEGERNILRSNMIVLRVGPREVEAPWIVMGRRAEELIQDHPLATYLYAPKKYVRHWPDHLRAPEPTSKFRGILGQRDGLHPMLHFVRHTLSQMLQHVLAALTNPHGTADAPEFYPQVSRLMATYPLTWREVDKQLFKTIVEDVAEALLVQEEEVRSRFQVDLVCSEPVAVAAYVLWESFFHFGTENLRLASSTLGNARGTPELRMLVLDIGGGSTDVACVDASWETRESDGSVDVAFRMLESMRFQRAGDRLSHLVATALRVFLRDKHGIDEPLDFRQESRNAAFTRSYKRLAVSRLSELAEEAKAAVSEVGGVWRLEPEEEYDLLRRFEPLLSQADLEERARRGPHFELDEETLAEWASRDRQSLETNGEPGFMDIFLYLEELCFSLREKGREPHLLVLSGRTTRLSFIRELVAKHSELPLHRVRTLDTLLPDALKLQGYDNMDKLAVVCGAQRFRFGDHIRFSALPDSQIFNRYIGTVRETPTGLKLNHVLIRPGDTRPRTVTITAEPGRDVRLGHAFREDGSAQVIANISNDHPTERFEITLDVVDDDGVVAAPHEFVTVTEWVPGGNDLVVDNFNDTGCIDEEPAGFIERIVRDNVESWQKEVR